MKSRRALPIWVGAVVSAWAASGAGLESAADHSPASGSGATTNNTRSWALLSLTRPAVPRGPSHPIDAFVRAKLDQRGIRGSSEADRRTLARRLHFDLTGLPPTAEAVEAFVADRDPRAYDAMVDRLLASPQYGEQWGRHWLDVASYADTHGNDHDYARTNAWPYRDYVIRSFNSDKPYARFVMEQVAGDALFPEDPEATLGLGFLAAGPWDETLMVGVREDTVDHRMAQNLDRDAMVSAVMNTFQSLTVHCARCHQHKFDPISQREYYALQAVFAGVDRTDRPVDVDQHTAIRRRELTRRLEAITKATPEILVEADGTDTAAKLAQAAELESERRQRWTTLDVATVASATAGDSIRFARLADGSWRVSGARPDKDTFIVSAAVDGPTLHALRLEVLPDESLPHGGPGRYDNGNLHLSEFRANVQPRRGETHGASPLVFAGVTADHADGGDVVANAIDGRDDTYWSVHPRYGEAHEAVFELKGAVRTEGGVALAIRLEFNGKSGHQAGRFRLSYCDESLPPERRAPLPAALTALLRVPVAQRTAAQRRELALGLFAEEARRELAALPPASWVYAVGNEFPAKGSFKPATEPRPIHLLNRGDINKPGEAVGPGTLACLPGLGPELAIASLRDESQRRAALARWLTDTRNVLTWRSIVNRVWQHHFGRGLCDTPNDFGRMGGEPSHPELLDWLAVWFRDEAQGSLKALHRLIVTSDTYRQSSVAGERDPRAEIDADNRLLWRMNRRRLTAEEVRDAALQLSGRLDLTQGGPAVVQFRHRDKATFMPDGGAPPFVDYESFDADAPENRRRAVYRFIFRTVPDPFMEALDCPDGSALTPVRSVSATALQALAMLNDAFLIRQSEHLAAGLGTGGGTPAVLAGSVYRSVLQRAPTEAERARLAEYITQHGLANACHALLNSNEFLHPD